MCNIICFFIQIFILSMKILKKYFCYPYLFFIFVYFNIFMQYNLFIRKYFYYLKENIEDIFYIMICFLNSYHVAFLCKMISFFVNVLFSQGKRTEEMYFSIMIFFLYYETMFEVAIKL